MSDPPDSEQTPDSEETFDEYLDALLRDGTCSPEEFLRGVEVDAELRERLEAVHRAVRVPDPSGVDPSGGESSGSPEEGSQLGEFRLLRRLGEGGMGVVYLAEQESLGRRVALKLLRPELASSPVALTRFEREARAVARLNHPHVVKCFAFGEDGGQRFLVMELAEGRGLDEIVREAVNEPGSLEVARVLRWMAQIADGLDAAHRQGLIHRDVKPANIRISPDDRALLLDFGVARDLDEDTLQLTRSFLGSPSYMAPEQIAREGGQVDARTDVYSLGVTLYECVTEVVPFAGDTVEALFHQILERDPPAPRSVRPSLSRDLETVILRAIDKDPAQRYPSASAFRDDLQALLEYRPIQARRAGLWRRARQLARRRPLPFALSAAVLLTLTILGGAWLVNRSLERTRQADDLRVALEEARDAVESYGREIGIMGEHEADVLDLRRRRTADYMTDEEHRELDQRLDEVVQSRTEREQSFHATLGKLRRAEGLGADELRVRELLGRLYLARLEEVRAEQDPVLVDVYRDLVLEHDPRGVLRRQLAGSAPLSLAVDVDGAEVHVFKLVEAYQHHAGGEHRFIAAPLGAGETPIPLDAFCLEIIEGLGELQPGDLIYEIGGHPVQDAIFVREGEGEILELDRLVEIGGEPVRSWYEVAMLGLDGSYLPRTEQLTPREFVFRGEDGEMHFQARSLEQLGVVMATPKEIAELGGCSATVVKDGKLRQMVLPEGLRVRPTAAPWIVCEASLVGSTPIDPISLPRGSYGVLIRAPGHPLLRHAVRLPNHAAYGAYPIRLALTSRPPPGFVRVAASPVSDRRDEFFIQRLETTFGEYLEFLNDPKTQAHIDRSGAPTVVPRGGAGQRDSFVVRDDEGQYRMQEHWPVDLPVFGVSWHDAVAYAQWRTERARLSGLAHRFALPTHHEWVRAAVGNTEYPFGNRFHPRWMATAFSRRTPFPFRVGSFPIDESILGALDLSGNVSEWLDEWWLEDRGLRRHAGGSWADGGPEALFGVQGGNGTPMDSVASTIGFRLALTIDEEPR